MPACPECGAEHAPDARFCSACGDPLGAPPVGAGARKTVSILFCDLVGSTGLGERLDSESLRAVLSHYFEAVRAILDRHEARIEKFIGDAVMAVFGLPAVREDDAARAIRAASEIQPALDAMRGELQSRWGVKLETRIGVSTGEVVANQPSTSPALVTGDPVNTAARLEQLAGPGEVLIDGETYRLVREGVRVDERGLVTLRGKAERVEAFRLFEVADDGGRSGRRPELPMVGRARELATLREALDRVGARRRGELVHVVGAAGSGKSRLAQELAAVAGDTEILEGTCLSYGRGVTYLPLGDILRQAAGISPKDTAEAANVKLARLWPPDATEEDVGAVAAALGLSTEAFEGDRLVPSVRRLFETLGASHHVVLVFNDLQWAEPHLLDLVESLAEPPLSAPVLILTLARPELIESRPSFGSGFASRLTLASLDSNGVGEMLRELLHGDEVSSEVVEAIVGATGGNPLFVTELARMWVEDGSLILDDGGWCFATERPSSAVPASVRAVIGARLDRLGGEDRAVLGAAAVAGDRFTPSAVETLSSGLSPQQVTERLRALEGKDLIRAVTDAPESAELEFHHGLVREVTYAGILKETRTDLHARFADWLEKRAGDRVSEYEEIVGHHLERACAYTMELGLDAERARELGTRAGARLGAAGQRALRVGDVHGAVNLLGRALALPGLPEDFRRELALRLSIALAEGGESARAEDLLTEQLERERRERSYLLYRDEAGRQRTFDLDAASSPLSIGRRTTNDLPLPWDGEVSRLHARLESGPGSWRLVDEGISRNGSYVNGERVTEPRLLRDGDSLRLGTTVLTFRAPTERPQVNPAPAESALTALGRDLPTAQDLSLEEVRLLGALDSALRNGGPLEVDSALDLAAAELNDPRAGIDACFTSLTERFGTEGLPGEIRVDRTIRRARAIGAL